MKRVSRCREALALAWLACMFGCQANQRGRGMTQPPPDWWIRSWVERDIRRRATSANPDDHWAPLPLNCRLAAVNVQPTAHMTWTGYESDADAYKAMYVWNGKELAQGDRGFGQVLGEFERLPEGSLILVYPAYLSSLSGSGATPSYPWRATATEWPVPAERQLDEILVKRQLVIYLSDRDHKGRRIWPSSASEIKEVVTP